MAVKSDAGEDWVDLKVSQDMDDRFLETFAKPAKGSIAEIIRLLKPHRGPQCGFPSPSVEDFVVQEPSRLEELAVSYHPRYS
jgi:hypothetical protein